MYVHMFCKLQYSRDATNQLIYPDVHILMPGQNLEA